MGLSEKLMYATVMLTSACAVVSTCTSSVERNQAKEAMKKLDAEKYYRCLDEESVMDYYFWPKTLKETQDSLRIDSIAKANYAKGAQMVRDSIKNANAIDTAKALVKVIK